RLVFEAGLAQAHRQIDESRRDEEGVRIDHAIRMPAGGRVSQCDDSARRDEERLPCVDAVLRIDDAAVADFDLHRCQFPARMPITAIRTAMPKVTCGRITECLPSATLESISTPRFIGPGCMTIASLRASASLSSVRP